MSLVPEDLRYTKDHEWTRADGARVQVGITDHAQTELTDVVYVELPSVGREFARGDVMAVVESVKSVSEIFAPLSGKIIDVNLDLEDRPETINEDPYGKGWLVLLETSKSEEMGDLIDAAGYKASIGE